MPRLGFPGSSLLEMKYNRQRKNRDIRANNSPSIPYFEIVTFFISFTVVITWPKRVVSPQTVNGFLDAHRGTDDLPVSIVEQAGNPAFRAQFVFDCVLRRPAPESTTVWPGAWAFAHFFGTQAQSLTSPYKQA